MAVDEKEEEEENEEKEEEDEKTKMTYSHAPGLSSIPRA